MGRLSSNSEIEETEPKPKIPKVRVDSDGEPEAKKAKVLPDVQKLARIPKLDKPKDSHQKQLDLQKSLDDPRREEKNKHRSKSETKSSSKSKHDSHRHKSSERSGKEREDKHKKHKS